MRTTVSLVACLLAAGPAYAKNDQVLRAPVPDWVAPFEPMAVPEGATGLMFVRRNEALIHLDQQGQAQYQGYRIKILHPNALQFGNLAIAWNPAAGAPTIHVVKIYRGGEAIDDAARAEIRRAARPARPEAGAGEERDQGLGAVRQVRDDAVAAGDA